MSNVVLIGDSIFDNARYVPDEAPVIEQVRQHLPPGWKATLLAVDGAVAEDVARQMTGLPIDCTHLFVSAGGNDALSESLVLKDAACTVGDALTILDEVQARFRESYRSMLRVVLGAGKPTTLCTVYDAIPGLGAAERVALGGFNEIISREAFKAGLPVIDLRLVCSHADDYSPISPIEPSVIGGAKIARVISEVATGHDFTGRNSIVYR